MSKIWRSIAERDFIDTSVLYLENLREDKSMTIEKMNEEWFIMDYLPYFIKSVDENPAVDLSNERMAKFIAHVMEVSKTEKGKFGHSFQVTELLITLYKKQDLEPVKTRRFTVNGNWFINFFKGKKSKEPVISYTEEIRM